MKIKKQVMTEQGKAQEEIEAFKWMTSKGYDRKASKDIAQILVKYKEEQLRLHVVGWQSEQLPDFDVQEINEILKECKENKDDLQTLITRIWNKGYITGVCYDAEND